MKTIDLTPTWAGVLRLFLEGYENGTPKGRAIALEELGRMAALADLYVREQKEREAAQPQGQPAVSYAMPQTRVERAREFINEYDEALESAELAPNGDDYNRLRVGVWSILNGIAAPAIDVDGGR